MAADLILIVGCTGAGKTTYARRLADEIGGIRFSIDEWMMALFWKDSPQPIEFAWTMERVERCERQIFAMAEQLASRGITALLDLGFTKKDHRDRFRQMACEAGLSAVVHFVDVPVEERWRRVERRNDDKGETYAMTVDRDMFDFMEGMWEPPAENEWQANGGKRIDSD
ncbi:ATP-binding protein [Erythrobacter litoralis]|uniref:AAA family ATPase n=1 Tax=Erythrobacter litoralis TaxID=39960 RepID=UPI0024351930|nr:ATP-binding protein [Erythrobacter litoralis]MDG6079420.1 ATP-binding protein [Erythrobacter litoralis]